MSGHPYDILVNSLEELGAELSNRAGAIENIQVPKLSISEYADRTRTVSDAINYASNRLTEVMTRLQQISWMRHAVAYETPASVFDQVKDIMVLRWRTFMGLAIKDFHLDISSLMDALALVVIQTGDLTLKDKSRFPGWTDISKSGKYRNQMESDIIDIVDGTDSWWPDIKEVRHIVTHRKHDRIIFGNSEDGLLFQIYDESKSPKILLPEVLYKQGHNVVDFELYSTFVIAEVITLLDDFGTAIAPKMQVSEKDIKMMNLRLVEKSIAQSLRRLIKLARV